MENWILESSFFVLQTLPLVSLLPQVLPQLPVLQLQLLLNWLLLQKQLLRKSWASLHIFPGAFGDCGGPSGVGGGKERVGRGSGGGAGRGKMLSSDSSDDQSDFFSDESDSFDEDFLDDQCDDVDDQPGHRTGKGKGRLGGGGVVKKPEASESPNFMCFCVLSVSVSLVLCWAYSSAQYVPFTWLVQA